MKEEFRFIDLDDERIFAAFNFPVMRPSRALVICHPMGEEKLWAHRVLVSLSRDLADAGYLVVRFDFRGEGDSDRQFEEADLDTRIQDTRRMIDAATAQSPGIGGVDLLGLRLGATVATAAAVQSKSVSRLVLWDPVVDGAAYMQGVLRWNLMFQMAQHKQIREDRATLAARLGRGETVNIEGYELSGALLDQVSAFRFADALAAFPGRKLIMQIAQGDVSGDMRALASGIDQCDFDLVTEEPFWRETKSFCQRSDPLTLATINWLAAGNA